MKSPNTANLAVGATAVASEAVDTTLLNELSQGDIARITPIAPEAAALPPISETPLQAIVEAAAEADAPRASYGSGQTSQRPEVIRPCDFHLTALEGDRLLVRHIPTSEETEMSREQFKALLRG